MPTIDSLQAVIVAHQDNTISNEIAAQLIMGALGFQGHLPVGLGERTPVH